MFTPPPSPLPKALQLDDPAPPVFMLATAPTREKAARRTRWTILLVPLALMLITASSRYASAPSSQEQHVHVKRQQEQLPSQSSAAASSLSEKPTPTTVVTVQDIPSVPSNPPILPTPFPQPFDNSIGQNFSTQSCSNFFLNMTNAAPFRYCRPFSMLLQSSSAFVDAQDDITMLNNIIWGTCNTSPGLAQCKENMEAFASTIKSSCAEDLRDNNALAVNALQGLQTYALMNSAGCLVNPTTNNYCYVEAVFNSNPSDLYFYQLPVGIALPKTTEPTCSACTQSLLGLYNAAASSGNATKVPALGQLKPSYDKAAALANKQCGVNYAPTSESQNTALSGVGRSVHTTGGLMGLVLLVVCALAL